MTQLSGDCTVESPDNRSLNQSRDREKNMDV